MSERVLTNLLVKSGVLTIFLDIYTDIHIHKFKEKKIKRTEILASNLEL